MKNSLKILILFSFFINTIYFSQVNANGNYRIEQDTLMTGIVYVKCAELHYIIEGKGIPCLVLGHSLSQRLILSQTLKNHFTFIFSDLRHDAQSHSSLEISEITLDTYINDINAIMDSLHLEKTALFAHSHHAFIAVEYARKYPDKISHIIITGCKPSTAWGAGDEFWESDASKERKLTFKKNFKKLRKEGLTKMLPKERYVKTYVAMTPKLMYDPNGDLSYIVGVIDNDKEVFLHLQLSILGDYDIIEGSKISIPVFLALGRYDYECPYILWEERKSIFLNLSYNLFEKSGHFPMVEEQDLFDKKIIDWIGNQ